MAADSALTEEIRKPNGTLGDKVYYGAQKLFAVPKIRAGVSYWGWGDIPHAGAGWLDKQKLDRTEMWLPYFLERNKERYDSIQDLAQLLEDELRKRIPEIDSDEYPEGDGGIHLAGYDVLQQAQVPVFWHIHNGKSAALPRKKLDPSIVNANNDISPELGRLITEKGGLATIRNGDIKPYVVLWELLFKPKSAFSEIIRQEGFIFPHAETLEERADLLRFQIQTVAGLYRFSKEGRGIGGSTTTLTIGRNGIVRVGS